MQNLLHGDLSPTEIANILASTSKRSALPKYGSTEWTHLRENPHVRSWLMPLTRLAKKEAANSLPELTDALYRDFFKTGMRLPFENVYFERRRQLGRAAMALLMGDAHTQSQLLPSFLSKLEAIMDEAPGHCPLMFGRKRVDRIHGKSTYLPPSAPIILPNYFSSSKPSFPANRHSESDSACELMSSKTLPIGNPHSTGQL